MRTYTILAALLLLTAFLTFPCRSAGADLVEFSTVLAASSITGAAEEPAKSDGLVIIGRYQDILDNGRVFIWSGGCTMTYGELIFSAALVVHYPKEHLVYAEGTVICDHPKFKLCCDRMIINTEEGTGYADNVVLFMPLDIKYEEEQLFLVFITSEAGTDENGTVVALDNKISASTFIPPNFYLSIPDVEVGRSGNISADNATLKIGRLPVLYIPRIKLGTSGDKVPIRVGFGRTSYLGAYGYLEARVATSGPVNHYAVVGLYQRRGVGMGYAADYAFNGHFGEFRSFYINDSNDDEYREKRYEFEFAHRSDLNASELLDELTVTLELHRRSDEVLHRDFFRSEWLTEKDPESYLNIQQTWDRMSATTLARTRVSNYETETEYLPEVSLDHYGFSVAGARVSFSAASGYLERETIDPYDNYSAFRQSIWAEAEYPIAIANALVISPGIGGAALSYSETRGDEDPVNAVGYGTLSLSSRFVSGIWDISPGVARRHVIIPTVEFLSTTEPSNGFADADFYDHEDLLLEEQSVNLVLTNVIEEKRTEGDRTVHRDRFLIRIENKYYFDCQAREELNDGESLGNLNAAIRWNLFERIYLVGDFDYNWNDSGFPTAGSLVGWNVTDHFSAEFGARYIRDNPYYSDNDTVDTNVTFRYSSGPKWFYTVSYSHIFTPELVDDFSDLSLTVYRKGQDFTTSVTVGNDDDGFYFFFSIYPRIAVRLTSYIPPERYR